ncbi:MAG: indolepyruvate oxidoreductase subunit beta [Anaerolineales bacterium]|uniref:Indolepyruvate oxidoreductase subunit beta n=1 Tax=Candidatus Desulfolinea nitratireducens TaxID=2841698 RepID=A0A8J6NQH5_9CHLR|nr:indolepyruvate oxidoreductase subunit beta [Candidatus Desulfolinea nitratireducens]MBL6960104.1 indolepyruvate oxidoreductase subunit beta [Anaerolineales bacterium]
MKNMRFLLVGVGGQGTILASNVLAELGISLGYDVKKAEVHGMSQRGGSVVSHVSWGEKVYSPVIPDGEADILIAFEKLEAIRFVGGVREKGMVLVNDYEITPLSVSSGMDVYPANEKIKASFKLVTDKVYWVRGVEIAKELGNIKAANVVLLGALSKILEMESDPWLKVIEARVPPKFVELNREAFQAGRQAVK